MLSALGVGFLLAAPLLRALLDRVPPRILLTATLTATAAGQFGLFTSTSLVTALPAAVAIGTFGSMSEVIPQTALQRVIPNAVLGRIGAVFLTGEAAVGLLGALAGLPGPAVSCPAGHRGQPGHAGRGRADPPVRARTPAIEPAVQA